MRKVGSLKVRYLSSVFQEESCVFFSDNPTRKALHAFETRALLSSRMKKYCHPLLTSVPDATLLIQQPSCTHYCQRRDTKPGAGEQAMPSPGPSPDPRSISRPEGLSLTPTAHKTQIVHGGLTADSKCARNPDAIWK